jgi:DHA2 family multidrug resistance protein
VVERLSGYTRYFMGKGSSVVDARHQALGLLDAGVVKQSNAFSFGDAYLLLGCIFLASLPLLLLSSPKTGKKPQVALADH